MREKREEREWREERGEKREGGKMKVKSKKIIVGWAWGAAAAHAHAHAHVPRTEEVNSPGFRPGRCGWRLPHALEESLGVDQSSVLRTLE